MAVTRLSSMVTVPAVKSLPPAACAMGEPHGAGGFADLKLGHYGKDGIEVVDVEGEIDISTAPRLRGLLIDLATASFAAAIVVCPEPRSSWSARSEARTNDLDGGENVGDQLDLPAGGCGDGAVAITEGDRTLRAAAPSFRAERRVGYWSPSGLQ
jgi:hypothetical protein